MSSAINFKPHHCSLANALRRQCINLNPSLILIMAGPGPGHPLWWRQQEDARIACGQDETRWCRSWEEIGMTK